MKRKIFSALAIMLFMSSSLDVFAFELTRCERLAVQVHEAYLQAGYSHEQAYAISSQAQSDCENMQ
jgi:hypothetical protein